MSYNIPHFDIISGMPPDHMHNVHLGVVRQMANMWLDSENHEKSYYLGTRMTELDQRLLLIRPPCNVTRVPRSFQQRSFGRLYLCAKRHSAPGILPALVNPCHIHVLTMQGHYYNRGVKKM
ncbi:hypothetical protein F7725_005297 [Dissostichus mawsoni]|uniref:Uncharacterized protein n=1 Tax=Dissostichus mawsoni TaxID=36200 RepID=A0A7J5YQU9_DISMA|nr:hypothetical protein F7725_005297 [Dissostichus mawsoni]